MPIYKVGRQKTDVVLGIISDRLTKVELGMEQVLDESTVTSDRVTQVMLQLDQLKAFAEVTSDRTTQLALELEALRSSVIIREIAQAVEGDPLLFEVQHHIGEIFDVEAKGQRSTIAVSLFPGYELVATNRFRLLGEGPTPGSTIYATYRKA